MGRQGPQGALRAPTWHSTSTGDRSMKPDEISETFDEISTQLYRVGERLEELRHELHRLTSRVNDTEADVRELQRAVERLDF